MPEQLDMGLMVEGIVELDPMTGRLVIRYEDAQGQFHTADIEEHLRRYSGDEVRCIITPLATVTKLAEMVERGKVQLEDVPKVPQLG